MNGEKKRTNMYSDVKWVEAAAAQYITEEEHLHNLQLRLTLHNEEVKKDCLEIFDNFHPKNNRTILRLIP